MTTVPVKIRTSERTAFMRCEWKWKWAYVDGLQPVTKTTPLRFGDLVHQALAAYYVRERRTGRKRVGKCQRGPHPAESFNKIYDEVEKAGLAFTIKANADTDDPKWGDARKLGTHMLENYIDVYGLDERWLIIAPEMPFMVPLVNPKTKRVTWHYVGTLDAVAIDLKTGQIVFLEHKTAATISTDHLNMDEQASSYWTYGPKFLKAKGILEQNEDLDGIEYNFLRKAFQDERPVNSKGQHLNQPEKKDLLAACEKRKVPVPKSASKEDLWVALQESGVNPALFGRPSMSQPPPLFKRQLVMRDVYERQMLHRRVVQQAWRMDEIRAGAEPLKSIIGGCAGMFGCEFRDMCELHEMGGEWETYRDLTMTTWDPYEIHDTKGDTD